MNTFTQEQFDQFLSTLKFPPNPFQLKILESIAFGQGNKLVSALAGSGKTTLLVQTAQLLKQMGESSAMYLAFNVKIRDELNERLPSGFTAINSHSLGLRLCKQIHASANPRDGWKKWRDIAGSAVEYMYPTKSEQYAASRKLQSLISKVMLNNTDIDDVDEIAALDVHYGLECDPRLFEKVGACIRHAERIFRDTGVINFDEMIYWPVVMNIQPPQHKWVFVDECQDLNILQQKIALASVAEGGRMIWVGDRRQSIYGFSGADAAAFDRIVHMTNAEVLPLNTCYRCPTSHLDLAREIVPEIEAGPNAIPGEIEYANPDELHKTAKPGMLLMCRLNAPLISAYFALIKNRIPAKVLGREIGKDLANTLDKVAQQDGFNYDQIVFYLERYRSQQMHMLMQKENAEQQIQNLTDKMECLIVCAQNFAECSDLECFKAELQKLFGDEDDKGTNWSTTVTLCTVHKAKGLEADLTGILKPDKMPLVWDNQAPWELEQEMNIRYVALTRAKKRMVIYGQFGETEKAAPNTTGHTSETAAEPVPVVVEEAPPAPALTEPVSSDPLQTLKNMTLFGDEDESEEATPAPEPAESKLPPIRTIPVRSTARQRLDELAESLTDDELDKIIQFFTALRDNRKEAKHAEPEPVH